MNEAYSTIRKLRIEGRRVIGCFPLYPPLELLHSLGLTPVVLWGLRDSCHEVPLSDRHLQTYTCSVGRCLTEFVLRYGPGLFDGIVMYNACDTLRNLPEILGRGLADEGCTIPIFRLHIPAVPPGQTDSAGYLRDRIGRFIRDLEKAFGVSFSIESFRASVELYRGQRECSARLQELVAHGKLSFGEFCGLIAAGSFMPVEDHLAMLEAAEEKAMTAPAPGRECPRVMVSGILPPPPGIVGCMETAGMRVADNDIAMFKRSYGYTPLTADDPAAYYLDMFSSHCPCTTILHTGDARIAEFRRTVREGRIDGVIFIGEKFCEYEYFEVPFLRKVLEEEGVRMLCLDLSLEDDEDSGSYRTRIEGFAEILQG